VHESGYSVVPLAGEGHEFRDPWGAPVENAPRPPPGDPRRLEQLNRHLEIDDSTCECGDGDRMDLGLAVDALLSLTGPKSPR
jgi:hypothetical protein